MEHDGATCSTFTQEDIDVYFAERYVLKNSVETRAFTVYQIRS